MKGAPCNASDPEPWRYHYLNPQNNVNNTPAVALEPQIYGCEAWRAAHSLPAGATCAQLLNMPDAFAGFAAQKRYVEWVVDEVGGLPNVLYEIANESPGSLTWQECIVQVIRNREPSRHPIVVSGLENNSPPGTSLASLNQLVFDSGADFDAIAPWGPDRDGYHYQTNPRPSDHRNPARRVVLLDTDHAGPVDSHVETALLNLTRGNHMNLLEGLDSAYQAWDPPEQARNLGAARDYARRIDLAGASVDAARASTGFCLANLTAGRFLAYLPNGVGTLTIDLPIGNYAVEWYAVATPAGQQPVSMASSISGGRQTLTAPTSAGALVFLQRS